MVEWLSLSMEVFKALYTYEVCAEDELAFAEDDLLWIVDKTPPDAEDGQWWMARLVRDETQQGLIPTNYVERVNKQQTSF